MLERLIPSKTRVKLLTLFLLNPEREIYLREAQRMTGENLNAVRRELTNLEEIGLLTSTRRGNARYYVVNRDFPIYNELTAIILKTEGVAKVVREHLAGVGGVDTVFIFGSFASGKAGAASDIDLFVVGHVDEDLLMAAVREYMTHERGVLEEITALRSRAEDPGLPLEEKLDLDHKLSGMLRGLMVQVENYPQLKASANMEQLQRSLNEVEEQLAAGRRAYNAAVTDYNNSVEMFPSNIAAAILGYQRRELFSIPEAERENVDVGALFKG